MKRTKRWLLIFAALTCLMVHCGAVRATSLIFGKSSTSTTTSTTSENPSSIEEEETTEAPVVANNETSTKPVLTGIPQIDYIWDPNLPRELNGYNLSDYPFYSLVPPPEEIDFKCDGLHDGFYASVKHKCQLYHHCLYGVRYDFLCANFTAFDQKTFICHFVSEVDCKNSPKYFHRNDALYQATTTTTTTTTTTPAPTAAPAAILPAVSDIDRPLRPGRPHRRPLRRRRPQVDYYYYDDDYEDDYYDDRITRRRKQRPRVRRPDYEDDYDDRRIHRDEDRHEKRPYNRDRLPDDDEHDYDRRKSDRSRSRNRPSDSRRTIDDDRRGSTDRRRPFDEKRPLDDRKALDERRPIINDRRNNHDDRRSFSEDRRHHLDRGKSQENDELEEDRRFSSDRRRINDDRRPYFDDDLEKPHRRDQDDDTYSEKKEQKSEEKSLVRPSASGSASSLSSLFKGPRAPPKVARPVPLTEKKKYEYNVKKTTTTIQPPISEEEYYDEYEDPPTKVSPKEEKVTKTPEPQNMRDNRRPFNGPIREDPRNRYETIRSSESTEESRERSTPSTALSSSQGSRYRQMIRDRSRYSSKSEESSDIEETTSKPLLHDRFASRNPPSIRFEVQKPEVKQEKERESPYLKGVTRPSSVALEEVEDSKSSYQSEEVTRSESEEEPIKEIRPIVRIVKRPFLPSRGGSPYLPRGLQPVGTAQKPLETSTTPKPTTTTTPRTASTTTTENSAIDMGSTISGVRLLEHGAPIVRGGFSNVDYPTLHKGPRTTQRPQIEPPRSPLDEIFENDYDVTLNDALNPTLKPLTSNRGPPTGFSYVGKYDRDRYTFHGSSINNNDSLYSSTAIRSSAIQSPSISNVRSQPPAQVHYTNRGSHTYYDDYEY